MHSRERRTPKVDSKAVHDLPSSPQAVDGDRLFDPKKCPSLSSSPLEKYSLYYNSHILYYCNFWRVDRGLQRSVWGSCESRQFHPRLFLFPFLLLLFLVSFSFSISYPRILRVGEEEGVERERKRALIERDPSRRWRLATEPTAPFLFPSSFSSPSLPPSLPSLFVYHLFLFCLQLRYIIIFGSGILNFLFLSSALHLFFFLFFSILSPGFC